MVTLTRIIATFLNDISQTSRSLCKTKATNNLAVIRRIRFNVKTRHRIYPDTLCATKWLETKPLLCKVYSDALFRLRFSRRVCAHVYVWLRETKDVSRDDILLYGGRLCGSAVCPPFSANSPRLGRRKSFLAEDEEIRAGTREMSLSLLFQSIKTIHKRVQFSFFPKYTPTHIYNSLARERVNKHTWHFR